MSISIEVEPATGLAIVTCSGDMQRQEAEQAARLLWTTPDWSGRAAVWDFRESQFDVSMSDVREVAAFVLRNQPERPPARVAFVTGREVDFGMARMFQVYREDPRTAFRVFRDYGKALRWARATTRGATG